MCQLKKWCSTTCPMQAIPMVPVDFLVSGGGVLRGSVPSGSHPVLGLPLFASGSCLFVSYHSELLKNTAC
jgi:hypothetical protein